MRTSPGVMLTLVMLGTVFWDREFLPAPRQPGYVIARHGPYRLLIAGKHYLAFLGV